MDAFLQIRHPIEANNDLTGMEYRHISPASGKNNHMTISTGEELRALETASPNDLRQLMLVALGLIKGIVGFFSQRAILFDPIVLAVDDCHAISAFDLKEHQPLIRNDNNEVGLAIRAEFAVIPVTKDEIVSDGPTVRQLLF
jgi:hypothetical protein